MKNKIKLAIKGQDKTLTPYVINYGLSVSDPHPAHIEIVGFSIDMVTKTFHITFCMGAYAADGRFVPAPGYLPVSMMAKGNVPATKAFWDNHIVDRTVFDLEEMTDWLAELNAVDFATTRYWGIKDLVDEKNPGNPTPAELCGPGCNCGKAKA
jgi:hypothetical protein